jgi:transposase-like protein
MKTTSGFARHRRPRTTPAPRAQLLAEGERSRLSAAAFARRHGLKDTTFCGWRQRHGNAPPAPGFGQIELPPAEPATALVLALGSSTGVRIAEAGQSTLAVRLLQALNAARPC